MFDTVYIIGVSVGNKTQTWGVTGMFCLSQQAGERQLQETGILMNGVFRFVAPQILASLSTQRFFQTPVCLFVLILARFSSFLAEESVLYK